MRTNVCPECVQGKHRNCDGRSWDLDADRLVYCECTDDACQDAREAFRADVATNL